MRKGYSKANDGLLARDSGEWAKEKLYYVRHYMAIFNGGMKKKWADRSFVDLMAGCGRNIIAPGDEFEGSPTLALKADPEFSRVILVEQDDDLLAALRTRVKSFGPRAQILPGDCNDPKVIAKIRSRVPSSSLGLVFVDMLGLDVTFDTLSALTAERNMDLVVTFQVNDLTRNVPLASTGRSSRRRLDAFFGDGGWAAVAKSVPGGRDLASVLTNYYCQRLATLGYQHTAQLHVLMKNSKNAPLYRLILAGRHERAADFFRKVSKIEYSGQRTMF